MPVLKRKIRARNKGPKRPLKEVSFFLLDILYNAVIIIALVVMIRTFLISPFRIIGSSMADTLKSNEFILIDKLSYHLGEPRRGDPIVFLPPIVKKNSAKFEEVVTTDDNGIGTLNIEDLRTPKQVFYCKNKLVQPLWVCRDKVKENDVVYYRAISDNETGKGIDLAWETAEKKRVTAEEVKTGQLLIEGMPNKPHVLLIYNATGPDYFVKRVIGIPGDTIQIENGKVYLKKKGEDSFSELNETYLNEVNQFNTYFRSQDKPLTQLEVPEGQYFVLGDNRTHSSDSRHWFSPIDNEHTPFVSYENISGRVMVVLWPLEDLRLIESSALD